MAQELVASARETDSTPYLGWMILDWLKARQQRGNDADVSVIIGLCEEVMAIAAGYRR